MAKKRKGQDCPANGWPEKSWSWIEPKPGNPEDENTRSEPLNDQERDRIDGPVGELTKNQDGKNQSENAALAPAIQNFTIHLVGQILAWIGNFASEGAGGNCSGRRQENLRFLV